MKCGHTANAVKENGKPVCVICAGITPDAEIISEEIPDLTDRKARCTYYGGKYHSEALSKLRLPFFEYKPDNEFDEYYCGCFGWN